MAEESEDQSSKTEEPTQKKLEEARKKGEIILSREVNHWFMILGVTLVVMTLAGPFALDLGTLLHPFISRGYDLDIGTPAGLGGVLKQLLWGVMLALLLPFLLLLLAALAGSLLQTGMLWAPDNLMPKLERISLFSGFSRLFSAKSFLEFLKGILKLTIVAVVLVAMIRPILGGLEHSMDVPVPAMLGDLRTLSLRILLAVLAVMFVLAVLDYLLQRQLFLRRMRMSRTELKDEYKQAEGDPHVKQRIRQIRTERARRRMMADVPKADVVITNPDHYAVALSYKPPEQMAPVVVAMGVDLIAQKIKEIAREHEIPIVENPPLARALYATADIDREIPHEHYRAVAEIISYVFKLKNKTIRKPTP